MPRIKASPAPPRLIGWREHVRLPDLALGLITAKVDTGARTAALHAEDIRIHGHRVRFTVPLHGRNHHFDLPLSDERRVKSTSGHAEQRAVIATMLALGEESWPIEVTLTDRAGMGVPMLLGRNSIGHRFAVHPARSFILTRIKPKKKKKPK